MIIVLKKDVSQNIKKNTLRLPHVYKYNSALPFTLGLNFPWLSNRKSSFSFNQS